MTEERAPEQTEPEMPWFIRKAMMAQGKYDPDEIAEKAATLDLEAPDEPEQIPLPPAPEPDAEQISLDGVTQQARARHGDPATSHAAALSLQDLRATQAAVFSCFTKNGPMHHEKLVATYNSQRAGQNWPMQSASGLRTRTAELVDGGLLVDSGRTVVLASNRHSIIWARP